jgi:fatty-acyl-CoA synthase
MNTWHQEEELLWTLNNCQASVLVTRGTFLRSDYSTLFAKLLPAAFRDDGVITDSAEFPSLRHIAFTSGEGPSWADVVAHGKATISNEELDQRISVVTPDFIGLLLYTSGSTAFPKGVLLRQGDLLENGYAIGERRWIDSSDIVWLGGPLFYGLGACNALPATLTHGAALVIQDSFKASTALDIIHSTRSTVFYGPGAGNITQAIVDAPNFSRKKLSSLVKGNAGMTAVDKHRTIVELGVAYATGSYGMTETYGNATGNFPDDDLEIKLHTTGQALPGFELRIVDPESRQPLSNGSTGLLLIRGLTTPGYWGDHAESANLYDSDGFLNTGDLGYLDEASRFVFSARLKEVIKSGGINISPIEVEQALLRFPNISGACVVGVPHAVRGEVPVAFVESTAWSGEDEVKQFLSSCLASFKVPNHIIRVTGSLPRLASGKVAKSDLVTWAKDYVESD